MAREDIRNGTEVLSSICNEGFRPDPTLTISEWAGEHRMLSQKNSPEPGRWKNARTPYLVEIMDALSPSSPTVEVVFMAGAQVGKTECGNNFLAYVIDHCPAPMMVVQPTLDLAKRLSKQRIDPMISESPRLAAKVSDSRSRDSGNTLLGKDFPGGTVVITGANSAVGLRSMPARFLFLDEIDAFDDDVDGEGSPIQLAIRRTANYSRNKKIFKTSTPKIAGRSKIERAYYDPKATQEIYKVPCPHCGYRQQLVWSGIKYKKDDDGNVTDVYYKCSSCEERIDEYHKTKMLAEGLWEAQNLKATGKIRSFHISSLYSPFGWYSWTEAVEEFLAAKDNPADLKTWINTVLGEGFKEKGEAPKWEMLYRRRENYERNRVPSGGLVLTAGVDVQGGANSRIEVEVVAWGRRFQSWSIDHRVFMGDTTEDEVWENLEKMLTETWANESGVDMRIQMMAVDSSAYTQAVYNWVRKHPSSQVMAVKGQETQRTLIGHPTPVDVNWKGEKISRGTMVWNIGVSLAKEQLYSWLNREEPLHPDKDGWPIGWAHFPEYGEEYFKQLCAEEIRWSVVRGFRRPQWEKTRERNEILDCRVYARCAAAVVGIDRWDEEYWDMVEQSLGILNAAPDDAPRRRHSKKPKRNGGYVGRWRGR